MDTLQGVRALLHSHHSLGVEICGFNGVDLRPSVSAQPDLDSYQLTWVSSVNLVPAILSSSFSCACFCLSAAIATTDQLPTHDKGDLDVSTKDHLHRLLLVAFALAFFISSSIFLPRNSSFFSSISNCCLNWTMASRADSLESFLPPPNHDAQPDMMKLWMR